ncbi:hypothetical protein [Streptacidiphilus rugosus]|uniref:hypothetical protein n=1 Tax=Streptacidiphilus rugosus TaxID=405783 RepID=UPI0005639C44|nr:hypothetical protein [Streptacidiphilus rugosus]
MTVVMSMRWPGVTQDQYDAVRDRVRWEELAPAGGQIHVAWFDGDALHVTDVWESADHFGRFSESQLMPAVKEAGIDGEPEVAFSPLHRRFIAPGVSGASS